MLFEIWTSQYSADHCQVCLRTVVRQMGNGSCQALAQVSTCGTGACRELGFNALVLLSRQAVSRKESVICYPLI